MTIELNEKLAKWAGLHRNDPTGGFWWDIEGNEIFNFHKRDERGFTDSLDACIKWLVPKLGKTLIGIDFIPPYRKQGEWLCNVEFEKVYMGRFIIESYRAKGETSALALCLAIEKLIDGDIKWNEQ